MARQEKKNPFSTKKWKRFQAPQTLLDLLKEDGEYSVYKGSIDGETSFFLIGKFGSDIYAYSISKENLSQLEKLQERLKNLECRFVRNEEVNPFEGWRKGPVNQMMKNYEARMFNGECVGRFGNSCYTFNMNNQKCGIEIDWVIYLGVYMQY